MLDQTPQRKEARSFHAFWRKLDRVLREKKGIYSGVPLGLLHNEPITTDDPNLLEFMDELGMTKTEAPDDDDDGGVLTFPDGSRWISYSSRQVPSPWRGSYGTAHVLKSMEEEKYRMVFIPSDPVAEKFDVLMETTANCGLFNLASAERIAQKRLFQAISKHQRTMYTLTGCFMERGASGVAYLLRKNRPTLAWRFHDASPEDPQEETLPYTMLCALCLHPLAYYTGTWAGALPPSDEVLSHLLYIRADEHLFWRKANQIPLDGVTSGL